MNQEVGKSIANGRDTKLKHFIYLDRSRLNSYTAQISDGLTQIRRLSETISQRDVNNPIIVGFLPKTRLQSSSVTGLAGQVNMADFWKVLVGDVDFVLEPIAIYS